MINETLALASEGDMRSYIYSISAPESPRRLSRIDGAISPAVFNERMYFLRSNPNVNLLDTLIVMDISDPSSPSIIGTFAGFHGLTERICVAGNYVFTGLRRDGIKIYDASNSATPELRTHYAPGIPVNNITIADTIAYLACNNRPGVRILDISDPINPRLIGTFDTAASRLVLRDTLLFSCGKSLLILNITDPTAPRLVARIPGQRNYGFAGCAFYENLLVTAEDYAGMRVFDITDPANPVFKGRCDTIAQVNNVAIKYPYAFFSGGYGLLVFDISDPANPVWITYYYPPAYAEDLALKDNIAYLATEWYGIRAIDVSNPYEPQEIGYYITPTWAEQICLDNNLIYVADEEGWFILQDYGLGVSESRLPWLGRDISYVRYQPHTKTLLIKLTAPFPAADKITVYNTAGACVYSHSDSHPGNSAELAVGPLDLPAGVYFLKLAPENNGAKAAIRTAKFIVAR
jgi:hypothetical protein